MNTEELTELFLSHNGILFDFDGVLANSEPYFRKAWNLTLKPYGHFVSEEDYWHYWASLGEGIEGEIRRHGLTGLGVDALKARQKSLYREYVNNGDIPLFPFAAELLRTLMLPVFFGRFPFGIASNSDADIIGSILLSGGACLPPITGGTGLRKKPAPDIFLKAAAELDLPPSEIIVFEDSQKGIDASDSGGFTSVLVSNKLNTDIDINCSCIVSGLDVILNGCIRAM